MNVDNPVDNEERIWFLEKADAQTKIDLLTAFERGDFDRLKQIATTTQGIYKAKTNGCSMCQFDVVQTILDFEAAKKYGLFTL